MHTCIRAKASTTTGEIICEHFSLHFDINRKDKQLSQFVYDLLHQLIYTIYLST